MMLQIHSKARSLRLLTGVALALLSGACTGSLSSDQNLGATSGGTASTGGSGPAPMPSSVDPGRVGIHRLNNTEYDNTVRDLLGTSSKPAATFLAEEGFHFDNTASALGMTASQYEGYLKAATDLMTEALATEAGRARFLSCTPTGSGDACARQIVETFGAKIYRRPLEAAEVERVLKVYEADVARGQSATEAIGQALRAMLAAASFLYRVELDPDPTSKTPHALSGYELASRLSYLHWSSMPDSALFDAAKAGQLSDASALEATVDRLLADPKASAFVESFAGQWLDVRKLYTHSTVAQIFPTYTTALADAMMSETYLWFQDFLSQDRPLNEWFTADFHYVNDVLAQHYGFPTPAASTTNGGFTRVEVTSDQRRGFLGLASFLTHTSTPSRTSPTTRGAWVLGELLCAPPPPPPPDVPKLDDSADPMSMEAVGAQNVRERLEKHRQTGTTCNTCHSLFDPMGLGLERYDGVGRYREAYPNGDAIAPEGTMPDGTVFTSPQELGALIGQDPRFLSCVSKQLFIYALGREIENYDSGTLQKLQTDWLARGATLRNLMKQVVASDAFRFRRGEGT